MTKRTVSLYLHLHVLFRAAWTRYKNRRRPRAGHLIEFYVGSLLPKREGC